MFNKSLYKQLKAWKKFGYMVDRLKELATERGYNEKDVADTLRYFEIEEKESFPANIGKGKCAAMIAICWTTTLIGLLHLIFLWKSKRHRSDAIIVLAFSCLGFPLIRFGVGGRDGFNIAIFIWFILAIIMTVVAVRAYNKSKRLRIRILNEYLYIEKRHKYDKTVERLPSGTRAETMIFIPCPNCKQKLHVPDGKILEVTCSKCIRTFDYPPYYSLKGHLFWPHVVTAIEKSSTIECSEYEIEIILSGPADSKGKIHDAFASIIAMVKDALLEQFFRNVLKGRYYLHSSLTKDHSGKEMDIIAKELCLYGKYKKLFLSYWTFKELLNDLEKHNTTKCGNPQMFLLDTILSDMEVSIASAFFPGPEPYMLTPEEKKPAQEDLLRRYAPNIALDKLMKGMRRKKGHRPPNKRRLFLHSLIYS